MEIPEHHKQAVIPHIMVDGGARAIEFYGRAFGAVELFRLEDDAGRIVHAEVAIHGATLMLGACRTARGSRCCVIPSATRGSSSPRSRWCEPRA